MQFSKRMERLETSVFSTLDEEKQRYLKQGKEVYDFTIGSPNIAPSKEIIQALIDAAKQPQSYMYALHDIDELRQTVKKWYQTRYEVELDADTEILEMDYGANEWLSDIQNQTRRLTELTNSLIMLARMEEQPAAEKIDFPLSDIAQEAAESFLALAKTQNKTLECRIQPMISMCGDEKALRQLITILLDNAVKYSQEGGSISLTLEKQKNSIRLSVFNTTPFLSRKSLEHLFDRFYRSDKARTSGSGFGIGLSIAQSIVHRHHGDIRAIRKDDNTICFRIKL